MTSLYKTTIGNVSLDGQTLEFSHLLPQQQKRIVRYVANQVLVKPQLKSYFKHCGERKIDVAFSSDLKGATVTIDKIGSIALPLQDKAMQKIDKVFNVFRYYQNAGILERDGIAATDHESKDSGPTRLDDAIDVTKLGLGTTALIRDTLYLSGETSLTSAPFVGMGLGLNA